MAWPDTDVQTYRLTLGEAWFYHDSQPPAGVSGRAGFGWTMDPFRQSVDGVDQPVIPHLFGLDASITARYGAFIATGEGSARAVWEGPVGVAGPRLGVAWSSRHVTAAGRWTLPVSTFDALLAAPSSAYDLSVSVGDARWRGALGAVYRRPLGDLWQPSATASVGVGITDHWTLEAKAEGWPGFLRAEVGTQYRATFGPVVSALGVATGLTRTPGTPQLRVTWTSSWAKREQPEAVIEPPTLDTPPSGVKAPSPLEGAQPVEPPESPADDVPRYNNPFDAAAGFFTFHPELRFVVETNGTREQAEQVVAELQLRGILRERIVRIDVVEADGPVVFDFVVVE